MAEPNKTGAPAKGTVVPRQGIVTNPTPPVDPDAPVEVPPPPAPETLPWQTQQEMAAGAATLKKNVAPVLGSGTAQKPPGAPEPAPTSHEKK